MNFLEAFGDAWGAASVSGEMADLSREEPPFLVGETQRQSRLERPHLVRRVNFYA
jgi:hypothetical protein